MTKSNFITNPALELRTNDFLNKFIICENVFNSHECDKIINLRGNKDASLIFGYKDMIVSPSYRNSHTNWISFHERMEWCINRISDAFQIVNNKYFNFNLEYIGDFNVLRYPVNGHYKNHIDLGTNDVSRRKLSMVCFLSSPKDYEGGKLVFELLGSDFPQKKGSIIFFPSYLVHKVDYVTRGERYTLVAWAYGPTYR